MTKTSVILTGLVGLLSPLCSYGQATLLQDNAGIFRQGFLWILDVDGNQQMNIPPDVTFAFGGIAGDIPISGDWKRIYQDWDLPPEQWTLHSRF